MRLSWIASVAALGFSGVVFAACGSSSGGGGGPGETDGGGEGGSDSPAQADQTASCANVAACYSVTVTIAPGSPLALCGSGASAPRVADYTAIPAGGGSFNTGAAGGGCQGVLTGCDMTLTCPNGEAWSFTFGAQGFDATVSLPMAGGTCMATAVGTKLAVCPVTTGDADAGAGEASVAEAGNTEGAADAGPDGTLDGAAPEASFLDAPSDSTGGLDSGEVDATADSSPSPDAAAPEAAVEASVEAGAQDTGSPVEAGDDAGLDAGADVASSGFEGGLAEAGDDAACSTCIAEASADAPEAGSAAGDDSGEDAGNDANDGGVETGSE
ncbi:MAG: hypothetical protein ACRENE_04405 [Polyangiaceae bacterium]